MTKSKVESRKWKVKNQVRRWWGFCILLSTLPFALSTIPGCARTVTSLQLAGNDLVLTVNLSSAIQDGNRYYVLFSGSGTQNIELPSLGDYFVAPGEGDFSEGSLKQFDAQPSTINAYYRNFFFSWSDVVLFDVNNASSSTGADASLIRSATGAFADTTTDNTSYSATVPSNIDTPYFPSTTQLTLTIPISQLSPAFAQGDNIYFKVLAVSDDRILSDVIDGSLSVENTSGDQNSGTDSSDRYSGSAASLEITTWSIRIQ